MLPCQIHGKSLAATRPLDPAPTWETPGAKNEPCRPPVICYRLLWKTIGKPWENGGFMRFDGMFMVV